MINGLKQNKEIGLKLGDKMPEILGKDQNGNEVKTSDYKGRKLVLYFYPRDSTPGCTEQACNLRDNYHKLQERGYAILGVSVDDAKSHKRFIERNNLPFPLIADEDKKLVNRFGVWGEKTLAGKKYMGIFRTTFIANENGVIEEIIDSKSVKTKIHSKQILKE